MERFSSNHELQSTRETKINGGKKIAVEKTQTERHKRSEIGDVRDVAPRVSFELATVRFQPNCTDWPSLRMPTPLLPQRERAHARTHTHIHCWKPFEYLSNMETGHRHPFRARNRTPMRREEAIPWSLLYGFHRFVSIMIV